MKGQIASGWQAVAQSGQQRQQSGQMKEDEKDPN
jgi:hypothetical protein